MTELSPLKYTENAKNISKNSQELQIRQEPQIVAQTFYLPDGILVS